ncbi:MAG: Wzz/FepE/Etk N-terminal domain-containing protein [bacterium]|nr:Wzz/FepE/Etk N-terminal domain-containing protein [bacterium]
MTSENGNLYTIQVGKILWQYKHLIIGCSVFCGMIALIISFFIPKTYEAKATLLVMPPKFQTDVQPTAFSAPTYQALLESRELVKEIIDQLQLKKITVEELQRKMNTKVVIESQPKSIFTPVIYLTVKSDSPETAAAIANKWAELFVARTEHLSSREIDRAYQLLTNQLDSTEQNLKQAEEIVKQLKEKYKLENLRSELAGKLQQLDGNSAPSLFRAQQPTIISVYTPTETQKIEQGYRGLQASMLYELSTTQNLLDKLGPQFSPDERNQIQKRIDMLTIQIHDLNKTIQQLEKEVQKLQNEIVTGETLISRAQREVDKYKQTYIMLAEKAEQAKIAKAEQVEDIKIFAKAVVPEQHIWPRKGVISIIAFFSGFFISSGFIVTREYFRTT